MLTKYDLDRMAKILRETMNGSMTAQETSEAFADMAKEANPRFDRQRFLRACGASEVPSKDQHENARS